jgi:hypothetical protein
MFAASKTNSFVAVNNYEISRSLRINSADNAILTRTPATATNRKTWTWSAWIKRGLMSASNIAVFSSANAQDYLQFGSDYSLTVSAYNNINYFVATTQLFRDPSAWYHIVVGFDSTQATASNRIKLYVNGVQVTAFQTANYPTQNLDTDINNTVVQYIGTNTYNYFNGYMTEVNFIDGQQLTPSSFGETNAQTGVWQPKAFAGTYGTNGYYLNFSDNSNTTAATLGKDYSGNGNNWTPNNFSVTAGAGNDSLVDSPTSYGTDTGVGGTVRGNYTTLNAVDKSTAGGSTSNGNLEYTGTQAQWDMIRGTMGVSSGKWYWEVTGVNTYNITGIAQSTVTLTTNYFSAGNCYGYFAANGNLQVGYNNTSLSYGSSYTTGDVIGVALDMDAGTLVFYKNNTSQGTAVTGLTGTWLPAHTIQTTSSATFNFGQRPFAYTAPSGYKALCTQNLPTPTIGATTATQAAQYFAPVLYTGTGSNLPVTVGFQPDMIWTKARSAVDNHVVVDAIRGIGNILIPNSTAAESAYGAFVSFDTNGFTKAAAESVNGRTYVAWNWKANGSGSTNTSGSITSTVSANTTSGFSVVTYTGTGANATVGHGLGVAPSMIIFKDRSATTNWIVYHVSVGNTTALALNLTNATLSPSTAYFNNTTPTSTVFTIGNGTTVNTSSENYVAYAFAEVAGYSKFGSYTGNGSTDGPFVYTGFKPAYVLAKKSSGIEIWYVLDSKRGTYNVNKPRLNPNNSDAESTAYDIMDFTSNGFKLRNSDTSWNGSGDTYIFAAFAESPFKYSLAR